LRERLRTFEGVRTFKGAFTPLGGMGVCLARGGEGGMKGGMKGG
jgi:hypothetical protein